MKVRSASHHAADFSFGSPIQSSNPRADPIMNGVHRDNEGRAFIKDSDQTHFVKYDADNRTWRTHSPTNPTKYGFPVRQQEDGAWHLHSEVGLKGGSPGRELQNRFNTAKGRLEEVGNEEMRIVDELDTINSEILRSREPTADLQEIRQDMLRDLAYVRQRIASAKTQIDTVLREAGQVRQSIQQEHSRLLTLRENNQRKEIAALQEITSLETSMNSVSRPPENSASRLQQLKTNLVEIQNAGRALAGRNTELLREMSEIPVHDWIRDVGAIRAGT